MSDCALEAADVPSKWFFFKQWLRRWVYVVRRKREPSNLEIHARRELELAGWFKQDGMYGDMMGHAVMRMIEVFADEGHSGMSAGAAIGLFRTVASFEPIMPLTGEDDEWVEVAEQDGGPLYQNKRCGRVFKSPRGAYDVGGRVFREPDGCCFRSKDSRTAVTFPYTPKTEYIDVPKQRDE